MGATYLADYSLTQSLLGCIVTLSGIVILKMLYDYYLFYAKLLRASKKIPGPPTIPLLGNAWDFIQNIDECFETMIRMAKKYPFGRLWLGHRFVIAVTKPEHLKIVMKSSATSKKSFIHKFMEPVVVDSLINGHGPKMQAHRKLLVPIINGEYLPNYMTTFNSQVRRSIDNLLIKMDGKEFDIYKETEFCVADIAFETIFGIPGVGQSEGDLTIPHAVDVCLEELFQRCVKPWLHPYYFFRYSKHGRAAIKATNTLHNYMHELVRKKRKIHAALAQGKSGVDKPKPSIMDLWMENVIKTNAMNDREIVNDAITLFIGLHDAVLGIFSFAMLMLAMHQDIQEKVREEVISIVGSNDEVIEQNIGHLKYLEMVIKETMRLFPVGPLLMREVTDDFEIDGCLIPKGSSVCMVPIATHTSKEYWDEPEKFIPERFLPKNSKDRHPFAYVPFSEGSRRCPGRKFAMTCLQVMIAQFIRKSRYRTNMKLESLKLNIQISARSKDGYRMSMEKIDPTSLE